MVMNIFMNHIQMKKASLYDYKAVIFDLDGTLYYQKPFRLRMLRYLAFYAVRHPSRIRDLFLIKRYREIREHWTKYEQSVSLSPHMDMNSRQYAYVAQEKHVPCKRVEDAVRFFIYEAPLKLLPAYKDQMLAAFINTLHQKKITVVVYSDYPTKDKLKALSLRADACFTSADPSIGCMKPDPKGLKVILCTLGIDAEDAIMVGDRFEKDGLAAAGNKMDYIILPSSRHKRTKLKELFT